MIKATKLDTIQINRQPVGIASLGRFLSRHGPYVSICFFVENHGFVSWCGLCVEFPWISRVDALDVGTHVLFSHRKRWSLPFSPEINGQKTVRARFPSFSDAELRPCNRIPCSACSWTSWSSLAFCRRLWVESTYDYPPVIKRGNWKPMRVL